MKNSAFRTAFQALGASLLLPVLVLIAVQWTRVPDAQGQPVGNALSPHQQAAQIAAGHPASITDPALPPESNAVQGAAGNRLTAPATMRADDQSARVARQTSDRMTSRHHPVEQPATGMAGGQPSPPGEKRQSLPTLSLQHEDLDREPSLATGTGGRPSARPMQRVSQSQSPSPSRSPLAHSSSSSSTRGLTEGGLTEGGPRETARTNMLPAARIGRGQHQVQLMPQLEGEDLQAGSTAADTFHPWPPRTASSKGAEFRVLDPEPGTSPDLHSPRGSAPGIHSPFVSSPVVSSPVVSSPGINSPGHNSSAPWNRQVDDRLSRIQQNIDQLAQFQLAQAQQKTQADQLQQATQLLQQLQQQNQKSQMQDLERKIEQLKAASDVSTDLEKLLEEHGIVSPAKTGAKPKVTSGTSPRPDTTGQTPTDTSSQTPLPADGAAPAADKSSTPPETESSPSSPVLKADRSTDGSDRFSLQIKDVDITKVLEMLGQLSQKNIVASKEVTGKISASLYDVDIDEALKAILKSGKFQFEKEGNFIYVYSGAESEARAKLSRRIVTKIYRPNFLSVKDLRVLLTPLLTEGIGKMSVTTPSEVGIPASGGGGNAGGDSLALRDALLVQDYEEVLAEVDRIVLEMDRVPQQVVIEAKILSVRLNDSMQFGVNFALLNGPNNQLLVSGNGQQLNGSSGFPGASGATIVPPVGDFIANTAGLKYGIIRGDVSLFINALENIADTNLIASPQLMVLNKQKAELIIGDRLSYKTLAFNGTQTVENVNFLDAGTKLRLRPFITTDGWVRMEIHPERSSATLDTRTGLPNAQTTEVTSNFMVRDNTTVVIGGLIEEQVVESQDRIPLLGALPVVGNLFRNKVESVVRSELIVLITPKIVHEAEVTAIGAEQDYETQRRADHFRDHLAPINRRNLARIHYDRALDYYERGDYLRARHHINDSLHQSKNDRKSLALKAQIEEAINQHPQVWLGSGGALGSGEPRDNGFIIDPLPPHTSGSPSPPAANPHPNTHSHFPSNSNGTSPAEQQPAQQGPDATGRSRVYDPPVSTPKLPIPVAPPPSTPRQGASVISKPRSALLPPGPSSKPAVAGSGIKRSSTPRKPLANTQPSNSSIPISRALPAQKLPAQKSSTTLALAPASAATSPSSTSSTSSTSSSSKKLDSSQRPTSLNSSSPSVSNSSTSSGNTFSGKSSALHSSTDRSRHVEQISTQEPPGRATVTPTSGRR